MNIDQRKMGVILSYLYIAVGALINIINMPLFLHFIGVSEYGIYQTIGSLIAYFSVLDFGLPSTIIVFYSRYKAKKDEKNMENVLAICSRIYVAITAAILVVGVFLYFSLDSIYANSLTPQQLVSAKQIYIIFLINVATSLPFQILNATITAYERFVFLRGASIIIAILQFLTMFPVLLKLPSATSIVLVQTVFNIIMVVLRCFYCFKILKVKIKLHFFDKNLFKSILKYSLFIFLNVIAEQLFWRSNMIVLSIFASSAAVAAYSITYQISYYYMVLSTAITGVFLPRITSMVSKGETDDELNKIFLRVGRIQFLLLSCVFTGFILFGRQFIYLWSIGKPGFESSYLMTLLIISPLTIDLIQGLAQTILQAVNKFNFRVIVFLLINVLNIAIAIPAAKMYGSVCCAAVSGGSFLILVVVLNVFYKKSLNLKMGLFWGQILKMCIPVAFCLFAGCFINYIKLPQPLLELGIKIFTYLVLYILVMWKFAMNRYEKNLLIKPINAVVNKAKRKQN